MMPWVCQLKSSSFLGSSSVGGSVTLRESGFTRLFAVTGHAPAAGITYNPEAAFVQDNVSDNGLSLRSTKLRGHSGGSSDHPSSNPSLADSPLELPAEFPFRSASG